jgi:hypothetical protein
MVDKLELGIFLIAMIALVAIGWATRRFVRTNIAARQTKSPGDQDGAKSEAGLLTICKPTHKGVPLAASDRRIGRHIKLAEQAKKEASSQVCVGR